MRLTMVLVLACLVAAASSSGSVSGQSEPQTECRNPSDRTGTCAEFLDCPELNWMIKDGRRPTILGMKFLQESYCGKRNGRHLFCCAPWNRHPNRRILEEGKVCGTNTDKRIRGGIEASLGKHPWLAVLFYEDLHSGRVKHECGGTLISKQHVLTAAHCVTDLGRWALDSVRLGEHDMETSEDCQVGMDDARICNSPQNFGVERTFIHEDYNYPNLDDNDIALLKLTRPVEEDYFVGKICLPFGTAQHHNYTGVEMTVAGFGKLGPDSLKKSSKVLMEVTLPGLDQEDCRRNVGRRGFKLTEKQVCAGGQLGRDSCLGDSGGPVIVATPTGPPYSLVGLVSVGPPVCGDGELPSINTRVSEYLDWILDKLDD